MHYLILLLFISQQAMGMIFPIISFSEETGTMTGIFIQHALKKNSDAQLFLLSQKKGQAGFLNTTNIPVGNEKLNIKLYASNTGESYYGIGNTTKKTDPNNLYYNELRSTITMEKHFIHSWDLLLGLNYTHYKENTSKNNQVEQFKALNDIGLILGVQIDTRDQEFNATTGYFNEIKLMAYNDQQILSNDIRYFYPLDYGIFASKLYTTQTYTNHDHIQYLSGIGNYYYLRGYKTNDIIDRHLSYIQLEYRVPTTPWLIVVPFVEAGIIGRDIGNIKKTLAAYGVGGYVPMGNGSFRVEMAYAEDNSEFYFGFNHVF